MKRCSKTYGDAVAPAEAALAGEKRVPAPGAGGGPLAAAPPAAQGPHGERMRLVGEIDTLEDPAFLSRITRMSAWIAGAGTAVGALAFALVPFALGMPSPVEAAFPSLWWFCSLALAAALSLLVHEAVHGLFFKAFAPRSVRVTFGFKPSRGMLYACSEGVVYTRRQYAVVAAAPAVAVTALFAVAGAASGWWLWALLAAVFHLSGCTGDLAYLVDIAQSPTVRWCEDTSTGVRFYEPMGADAPGSGARSRQTGSAGRADGKGGM